MMRQLGGAFGVATLVAVFAAAGSYASPQAFSDGYAPAIAVAAALSFAGAISGVALPSRHKEAGTLQAVPALHAPETS
jgi:hypothetical protein